MRESVCVRERAAREGENDEKGRALSPAAISTNFYRFSRSFCRRGTVSGPFLTCSLLTDRPRRGQCTSLTGRREGTTAFIGVQRGECKRKRTKKKLGERARSKKARRCSLSTFYRSFSVISYLRARQARAVVLVLKLVLVEICCKRKEVGN